MEPTNYMTGHLPSELTNLRTDESEAVCLWSASSAQREELLGATQEGCQDDPSSAEMATIALPK